MKVSDRGFFSLKLPDRTLVMKYANTIRDHISHDRELGVLCAWEDAKENYGEEMCDAIWSTLTTPQREFITRIQDVKYGR